MTDASEARVASYAEALFAVGLLMLTQVSTLSGFYLAEVIMGAAYGIYMGVDLALVMQLVDAQNPQVQYARERIEDVIRAVAENIILMEGWNDGATINNGGKRLYVSRVFRPADGLTVDNAIAKLTVTTTLGAAQWRARWPGADGNVLVDTQVVRSKNLAFKYPSVVGDILAKNTWGVQVKTAMAGAVVEVTIPPATVPTGNDALVAANLYVVKVDSDGKQLRVVRYTDYAAEKVRIRAALAALVAAAD